MKRVCLLYTPYICTIYPPAHNQLSERLSGNQLYMTTFSVALPPLKLSIPLGIERIEKVSTYKHIV